MDIGSVGFRTYAFVASERQGGIYAYRLQGPSASFEDYLNTRPEEPDGEGDLGPEGVKFVPRAFLAGAFAMALGFCALAAAAGILVSRSAEHPVVRVHPETGKKALYVNVAHTERFARMTREESLPILRYLYRHQVRPELTCRFRWSTGAIAFWDNRCAQHNAINDYPGRRRLMHRITLAGDRPRGV